MHLRKSCEFLQQIFYKNGVLEVTLIKQIIIFVLNVFFVVIFYANNSVKKFYNEKIIFCTFKLYYLIKGQLTMEEPVGWKLEQSANRMRLQLLTKQWCAGFCNFQGQYQLYCIFINLICQFEVHFQIYCSFGLSFYFGLNKREAFLCAN